MRRCFAILLWLGILGGSQAATPTFDELVALKGKALYKAADDIAYDQPKFSASELATIVERLAAEKEKLAKDDGNRYAFGRFFESACDKATGAELPRLIAIYVGLDPGDYDKRSLLEPLAGAWILRELQTRADWAAVELPRGEKAPPAEVADAPPDLIAAWQLCQRATEQVARAFKHDLEEKGISFQANERAFYALVDKVLQKQGDHLAQELDRFLWSGWCGTGSDSLSHPQSIAFLMALLSEQRIAEAVGAALKLQSEKPIVARDGKVDARIEFLKKCGLDWEALLVGAQLESERAGWGLLSDSPYLTELAIFGSERAAAFLLEMARRCKLDMRETYVRALTAFIPGNTGNINVGSSADLERQSAAPISDETKTRVLALLGEFATPDAPADVAQAALVAFARAKVPGTKPTLRALLQHPSPDVAEPAAQILRSLGETVAAQKSEPVRFQMSINGAPMTEGTSVSWKINFGTNGSISSIQAADEAGVIALERKNFLDRARKPSAVVLQIGYGSSEEPYFLVELPVPPDLDQLTPVNIQLWPVEIVITGVAASGSDGRAAVEIKRHKEEVPGNEPERYDYFDTLNRELTVTINTALRLSMMSGSYELEILAPGAERTTTAFKVENKPTRVPVRLQPGGDLRVELVRPDGERTVPADLLRDGQEMSRGYFDYTTKTYRGLPVGNYVLHVPSSAELAARSGDRNIAALHPYAGRDLPFTIVGNQATPVELGEIRLEAAGN